MSICLIPGARNPLGKAAYLAPITTVFGHPGRRFGMMVEALVLALGGSLVGVAWSSLGIYLGSLVIYRDSPATYTMRGIFLAVAMMVHGFLRSGTPRLFIFVLLLIIVSVVTLTSTATAFTPVLVTQILYPIMMAAGVIILVNLCVFPEFSSSFLGQMTIETLNDTAKALDDAGRYFTYIGRTSEGNSTTGSPSPLETADNATIKGAQSRLQDSCPLNTKPEIMERSGDMKTSKLGVPVDKGPETQSVHSKKANVTSLSALATAKGKLRTKLASCKAAQRECNFEVAVSVLPPQVMKPVSVVFMKKLVANTVALVGACESKYALLGDLDDGDGDSALRSSEQQDLTSMDFEKSLEEKNKPKIPGQNLSSEKAELDLIKPRREIEFGDVELLRYLLETVTRPYEDLQVVITRTVGIISACIAYTYVSLIFKVRYKLCGFVDTDKIQDVPELPSGARVLKGIIIEEMDLHIQSLQQALIIFDGDTASALEKAAAMQELKDEEPDIMPREEIFLVSSFLLNLRQAA